MTDSKQIDPTKTELFHSLWPKAQPVVRNFILGLLGRHGATDEVQQEVAYTCLRRMGAFDTNRDFTSWAIGVARNLVFTHKRRQIHLPLDDFPELEVILSDPNELIASQNDLRQKALHDCMKRLSEQQQRFIHLRYGKNLSYDEMGKQLSTRIGSIKVALTRVRTVLRQCVEHHIAGTGAQ